MRILCAVDGSECSQWGVQTLGTLAEREPEHGRHQSPILNRQRRNFEDRPGRWDGEHRELHHQ